MKNDSVPVERHGHTVVNYKEKLYLFGGTPDGSSGLSDLLVLDAVNHCWVRPLVYGSLPTGRYRHTATVIDSKMYPFSSFLFLLFFYLLFSSEFPFFAPSLHPSLLFLVPPPLLSIWSLNAAFSRSPLFYSLLHHTPQFIFSLIR